MGFACGPTQVGGDTDRAFRTSGCSGAASGIAPAMSRRKRRSVYHSKLPVCRRCEVVGLADEAHCGRCTAISETGRRRPRFGGSLSDKPTYHSQPRCSHDRQSASSAFPGNLTPKCGFRLARDTRASMRTSTGKRSTVEVGSMPREPAILVHRSLAYSALAC